MLYNKKNKTYFRNSTPYQNSALTLPSSFLPFWASLREYSGRKTVLNHSTPCSTPLLYLSFYIRSDLMCQLWALLWSVHYVRQYAFSARLLCISQSLSGQRYLHNHFKLSPIRDWLFHPENTPIMHILDTSTSTYPNIPIFVLCIFAHTNTDKICCVGEKSNWQSGTQCLYYALTCWGIFSIAYLFKALAHHMITMCFIWKCYTPGSLSLSSEVPFDLEHWVKWQSGPES